MSDTNALADSVSQPIVDDTMTEPVQAPVTEANDPAATPPADPAAETPGDVNSAPVKSRAQERIEELARERARLREEVEYYRSKALQPAEQTAAPQPAPTPADLLTGAPSLADCGYDQDLWARKTQEHMAQQVQRIAAETVRRQASEMTEAQARQAAQQQFAERAEKFASTAPDFADVVLSPAARITPIMAEAIQGVPNGPEVAYHLVKSGKDREISRLPQWQQAAEIGRISASLGVKPAPQVTKAPAPPQPVSTGASVAPTVGPRDDMSDADAVALFRQQRAERYLKR